MKTTAHLSLLMTVSAISCSAGAVPVESELFRVSSIYSDNMVLQRGRPIRIAGSAAPGAPVEVRIGGQTGAAGTDERGMWSVELPAMEAGGPYSIAIRDGKGAHVEFRNVMVGEVWLCSGQSNMEMPVWSNSPFWRTADAASEVKAGNHPDLRIFQATRRASATGPAAGAAGEGWQVCSPDTIGSFSAAGYFFGRELLRDLRVPIGVIHCSYSGSSIAAWIGRDALAANNRRAEMEWIDRETAPDRAAVAEKARQEWERAFYAYDPVATERACQWSSPDFDDSAWLPVRLPSEFPETGIRWYRRSVDVPRERAGRELELSLGVIDDFDEVWFNGVKVGATGSATPSSWSIKRCYRIPAGVVRGGKNFVAVRVANTFRTGGMLDGGSGVFLADGADWKIPMGEGWRSAAEFSVIAGKPLPERPEPLFGTDSYRVPSSLYNGMIAPWTEYPIRGVIWYQGESDVQRPEEYEVLQTVLIGAWREAWRDPGLAFVSAQLSAFVRHTPFQRLPDEIWKENSPGVPGAWPAFREAQAASLRLPRTGMVVTIDIGDHSDIHPGNKQTLGFRLAREAERICYGGDPASIGPRCEKMTVENGVVRLFFSHADGGLTAGGELNTFAVAGEDGKFFPAAAEIEGGRVLLRSENVSSPVAVRYAWNMYPGPGVLYNGKGFPAAPFRMTLNR